MKITSVITELKSAEFGESYILKFSNGGKLRVTRFSEDGNEEVTVRLEYYAITNEDKKEKYKKLAQLMRDLKCLQKMAKKLSAEIGDEIDSNLSGTNILFYININWKQSNKLIYHELRKI